MKRVRLGGQDLTVTFVTPTLDLLASAIALKVGQGHSVMHVIMDGWGLTAAYVIRTLGHQDSVTAAILAGMDRVVMYVLTVGRVPLVIRAILILYQQVFVTLAHLVLLYQTVTLVQ